jgi:uncharacterized protein YsxB (DUF464 family)
MKISENLLKKWVSEAIEDFIEEQSQINEIVVEAKIDYDHKKMMMMVKKDNFLKRAFKSLRGNDKRKTETLFKNFILGDKKMEKEYVRI